MGHSGGRQCVVMSCVRGRRVSEGGERGVICTHRCVAGDA